MRLTRQAIGTRQGGATLIEFALALILGVLPLVLGILQIDALLVARNTLELAAFLAARHGALVGAEPAAMTRELARGLVPLYVRASRDGVVPPAELAAAYAAAVADVTAFDSLEIRNPTHAELDRFGVLRKGRRVIPNDYIERRAPEVQRANVLTLEITHCQPLVVPLAGPALAAAWGIIDPDPQHQRCLAAGRSPIRARASVVMQSDVQGGALR